MPENATREALEELLDYLEQVETQSGAVFSFLKDNGRMTDEKLAPYLEQARTATGVKSRAIRARLNFLFSPENTNKSATDVNPTSPDPPATESARSSPENKPRRAA